MKKLLFAFGMLLTSTTYAEEMRFTIEQSCASFGDSLTFECEINGGEFVITKSGNKFSGVHPDGGPNQSLALVKSSPHIVILDYPVSYDGTSTVYLTHELSRVYWVSVAYSTFFKQREVTVYFGRRLR
jgi:hypothetical protein